MLHIKNTITHVMDFESLLRTQELRRRVRLLIKRAHFSSQSKHVVVEFYTELASHSHITTDYQIYARNAYEADDSDLTIRLIDHDIDINFYRSGWLHSITEFTSFIKRPHRIDWSRTLVDVTSQTPHWSRAQFTFTKAYLNGYNRIAGTVLDALRRAYRMYTVDQYFENMVD